MTSVTDNWNFNPRLQPTGLTFSITGGATPLMSSGWGYGASSTDGDILSHTIARSSGLASSLSRAFTYQDPANRLTSGNESGGWLQNYTYDAFGNRRLASTSAYAPNAGFTPLQSSTFPTLASQHTNNRWIRGAGDSYDAAGNQLSLAVYGNYGSAGSSFAYDGENRLLAASVANGVGAATFVYDGEGRRVEKITASGTTTYIHDAKGDLAAEYSTAAPTVFGTQYLTADHLGSTRLITDPNGNPERCIDYLPFGEEIPAGIGVRSGPCYTTALGSLAQYPAASSDVLTQKFTGKERDAETGLDYFGARYFSGAQGRFTSADPIIHPEDSELEFDEFLGNPQQWNKYGYALNNPLRYVDPDGEAPADPTTIQRVATTIVSITENAPAAAPAATETVTCPLCLFFSLFQGPGNHEEADLAKLRETWKQQEQQQNPADPQQQLADPQQQQAQPQQPGQVKPAAPSPQDAEHTKGARRSTLPRHQKKDPGTSPPPNYKPDRKYTQRADDKKKDRKKPPYFRKDRDKKTTS